MCELDCVLSAAVCVLLASACVCWLMMSDTHVEGLSSISHNKSLFSMVSILATGSFDFKYTHSCVGFKI